MIPSEKNHFNMRHPVFETIPNSKVQGVNCLDAASATILPTLVPPVKKMWSNFSFNNAVVSGMPPLTT